MNMHYIFLFVLFASFNLQAQESNYKEVMDQDWPNLQRYADANREIISKAQYPDVVFMGNSITDVWASADPEFFKKHNFCGRGIGGQTTPQMLIRFTPDVIDLRPKAVVILAGTNDIAGNTGFATVKMITDNIQAMAQLAVANNISVIFCSILPVYDYAWRPGLEPVKKIAEVNNWLKRYAEENGHIYLDFFTPLADTRKGMKTVYSEDGVHPNEKGYEVMKPLVLEAINQTLEGKQ